MRPGSCRVRVSQVIRQTTIQFLALGGGDGKRLGILGDAIPNGFNEFDTLLDAKGQDLSKLGWTHAPEFTSAPARMQSVRIAAAPHQRAIGTESVRYDNECIVQARSAGDSGPEEGSRGVHPNHG